MGALLGFLIANSLIEVGASSYFLWRGDIPQRTPLTLGLAAIGHAILAVACVMFLLQGVR